MAKILSLLAYAGVAGAALAQIAQDVATCAARSIVDGDRSFAKDTVDGLTKTNGQSTALRFLLPALAESLKSINDNTTNATQTLYLERAAFAGGQVTKVKEKDLPAARKSAAGHSAASSLVARVIAAVSSTGLVYARKQSVNVKDFASVVGEVFTAELTALVEALKPPKKEKAPAETADTDTGTGTADTAETADTGTSTGTVTALVEPTQSMGFAQAVRAVRTARAQTARARQERDTARAEVARLLALMEGMRNKPAKKAKEKAAA